MRSGYDCSIFVQENLVLKEYNGFSYGAQTVAC